MVEWVQDWRLESQVHRDRVAARSLIASIADLFQPRQSE